MNNSQSAKTPDSLFLQAIKYWHGEGGYPEDPKQALLLFETAAAQNHPDALFFAAKMLENGLGIPFDQKKAFGYMERAAALGHIDAIYSLGYYYMEGGMANIGYSEEVLNQISIPKNEAKGLGYYKQAAAHDHKLAVFRLARYYYYQSKDSPEKLAEAMKWYQKGIELGEASCMIDMADYHILGIGVGKNKDAARQLYEQAAKTDDYIGTRTAADRLENFDDLEEILEDDR